MSKPLTLSALLVFSSIGTNIAVAHGEVRVAYVTYDGSCIDITRKPGPTPIGDFVDCLKHSGFRFRMIPGIDDFQITSQGVCLIQNEGNPIIRQCDDATDSEWRFDPVDDRSMRVFNVPTELCLMRNGDPFVSTFDVILSECDDDPRQIWDQ